ncbi:response regulator transcription factor [Novosphingobium sp. TH158]|uniref:response regulator transcription factor n=1 Tax=Novosphingobium sp. TH158 TaxID=2067455 RepID=UPI000C79748D|nr:LuxR C-terminal-related transcriptional regulator [Novosphingobium sp. TH158]PLK27623.1 LuxR family transcriptional regulator [Novosphingobium sp. TH158]
MTRTSILLVDSDLRRRAAISHCLSGSALHVEPFEDAGEFVARNPREGIVLVHDDGQAIAPLLDHMGSTGNWLPIVAFAEAPDARRIVEAVLQGAVDYLSWPFDAQTLVDSATLAESRAAAMSGARLREAVARSRIERLTRREREVLAGVADGLSNRMIGEKLSISPRTVEIHRANMLNKMGANHTSEAIRIAIEASLIN